MIGVPWKYNGLNQNPVQLNMQLKFATCRMWKWFACNSLINSIEWDQYYLKNRDLCVSKTYTILHFPTVSLTFPNELFLTTFHTMLLITRLDPLSGFSNEGIFLLVFHFITTGRGPARCAWLIFLWSCYYLKYFWLY